jgi:transcriptional regulator with GAF, ATPase, and Fis domain
MKTEFPRENVEAALKQSEGRIYGPKGAACMLGIPPTTLTAWINMMGINRG